MLCPAMHCCATSRCAKWCQGSAHQAGGAVWGRAGGHQQVPLEGEQLPAPFGQSWGQRACQHSRMLTRAPRAAWHNIPAVRLVTVAASVSTSSRSCEGAEHRQLHHHGARGPCPCLPVPRAHRVAPLWGAQHSSPAVSRPAPQRHRFGVEPREGCKWGRALVRQGNGHPAWGVPAPWQCPALLTTPRSPSVGSCTTSSTVTDCLVCQVSWGDPEVRVRPSPGKLRQGD